MLYRQGAVAAIVVSFVTAFAQADVIISEIMYNPASSEPFNPDENMVEWVEIYNAGDAPVDVSGWMLMDEDGKTAGLPRNTTLGPKQAVVIAPGGLKVEQFREAWGEGIVVYPVDGWGRGGISGLANSPSDKNEKLTLRKADEALVDEVNYDDEGDWPKDDGKASIALNPDALDARSNDSGKNWSLSESGQRGGRTSKKAGPFGDKDIGSPGVVAAE